LTTSANFDLIGVPFDGWGAAVALREAGLASAFDGDVVVRPDPELPAPTPVRAACSGLMNEAALLAMVEAVHRHVSIALTTGPGVGSRRPVRST
jgi:hypothetical protein